MMHGQQNVKFCNYLFIVHSTVLLVVNNKLERMLKEVVGGSNMSAVMVYAIQG